MNHSLLNIAHRGYSGMFPENTILSISESIKAGANIAETDLQLTRDNKIVLFHDPTVERILKGFSKKSISDFTLEELQEKDFGSWLSKDFLDCKITTLEQILQYKNNIKNDFDYILEIKGSHPEILIPLVKDLIKKYNYQFTTGYLSVKDENAFKMAIQNGFKPEHIGLMQKKSSPIETIDLAKRIHAKIIQLRPRDWTTEDWSLLKMLKINFTIFYADTVEEYKFFQSKDPYGIFTNFPNRLRDFLKKFA